LNNVTIRTNSNTNKNNYRTTAFPQDAKNLDYLLMFDKVIYMQYDFYWGQLKIL